MKNNLLLSIIVPIYKYDTDKLEKFLKDLNLQKKILFPDRTIEIIIVSNSSNIQKNLILQNKILNFQDFKFYVFKDSGNPGLARNLGLGKLP